MQVHGSMYHTYIYTSMYIHTYTQIHTYIYYRYCNVYFIYIYIKLTLLVASAYNINKLVFILDIIV